MPHTRKHHLPMNDFLHRTRNWCRRADEVMQIPRLRIVPAGGRANTIQISDRSFRICSAGENLGSADQLVATPTSDTSLAPQHPWLPFSESPCWPYSRQYTRLQRSLTLGCRSFSKIIRPCHVLILLGFLTILGSLIPALWRSIARNDIQGGFSLAQYILGVGVFVVGCMVAIHSRACTCWQ